MAEYVIPTTEGDFKVRGKVGRVSITFGSQEPPETEHDLETTSEIFTRETFEGALDKVSRTVRGKYADVLPSTEEFIRDKRREAELEDR
jgi:hypothetical protein